MSTLAEKLATAKKAAETRKQAGLTLGDCMDLREGLVFLGSDRVGEDDEKVTRFKLGQKVQYAIARTITAITPHCDLAAEVQKSIFAEYPKEKTDQGLQVESAHVEAFQADIAELMHTTCEEQPSLHQIAMADLKVGDGKNENQIPGHILAQLAPWITDYEEED